MCYFIFKCALSLAAVTYHPVLNQATPTRVRIYLFHLIVYLKNPPDFQPSYTGGFQRWKQKEQPQTPVHCFVGDRSFLHICPFVLDTESPDWLCMWWNLGPLPQRRSSPSGVHGVQPVCMSAGEQFGFWAVGGSSSMQVLALHCRPFIFFDLVAHSLLIALSIGLQVLLLCKLIKTSWITCAAD